VIRERDQLRAELEALKGIYSSGPSRHLNSHSSARESLPQDPSSTSSEHLTRWLLAQNFMLSKQVVLQETLISEKTEIVDKVPLLSSSTTSS